MENLPTCCWNGCDKPIAIELPSCLCAGHAATDEGMLLDKAMADAMRQLTDGVAAGQATLVELVEGH